MSKPQPEPPREVACGLLGRSSWREGGARFGGYKQFALLAGRELVDWALVLPGDGVRRGGAGGARPSW